MNKSYTLFFLLLLFPLTALSKTSPIMELDINFKDKATNFKIFKSKKRAKLRYNSESGVVTNVLDSKDLKFILNESAKIKKRKTKKNCQLGEITLYKKNKVRTVSCFEEDTKNNQKLKGLADTLRLASAQRRKKSK